MATNRNDWLKQLSIGDKICVMLFVPFCETSHYRCTEVVRIKKITPTGQIITDNNRKYKIDKKDNIIGIGNTIGTIFPYEKKLEAEAILYKIEKEERYRKKQIMIKAMNLCRLVSANQTSITHEQAVKIIEIIEYKEL